MKIKTLLITLSASAMAFAEEAAPEQPSAIASFLPLILLFVVMWLFFIRPKQKEMKQMDQMRKELEEDGVADGMKSELDALEKAIEMDKEQFLRLKKDEIVPFIEEEIAVRYWYQEAGVKIRLRYDSQLKEALGKI